MSTAACGTSAEVLADIFRKDTHIAIWQRALSADLKQATQTLLAEQPSFQANIKVSPQTALPALDSVLQDDQYTALKDDIAALVTTYCQLFQLQHVSLTLAGLNQTMCPKFHTDRVPCRLLTTYQGLATQWLPNHLVDRAKLGANSNGQPDHQSGLFQHSEDIQQLNSGDVALLKGTLWEGNAQAGLVHRSPTPLAGERRLLLRLDYA